MVIHPTIVEVAAEPFLTVQSAALLDVDRDDSHGGEADHDDEANELAKEDGRQQEAKMPMNSNGFWSPLKTGMPLKLMSIWLMFCLELSLRYIWFLR